MAKPIPAGWHSVTPRLVANDPAQLVEFLKQAFAATGTYNQNRPSEIRIGDSIVMVSGITEGVPSNPAYLYLYLADVDAAYARALKGGAISIDAPRDMHYGDRRATIRDPAGNTWQIATHIDDVAPAEIEARLGKVRSN